MALFDSGTPLANVALSDTFNTWRVRTNQINTQAAGLASNNTFTGTLNTFNNTASFKGPVTAPIVTANTVNGTAANFTTLQADSIDFDGDLTVDSVAANSITSKTGGFAGTVTAPVVSANSISGGTVSGTTGSFSGPVTAPIVTANTVNGTAANFTTLQADSIDFDGDLTVDNVSANSVSSKTGAFAGPVTAPLVTANSVTATSSANLGAIGNVTLTGGSSGQFLCTDGSGNLGFSGVSAGFNLCTCKYCGVSAINIDGNDGKTFLQIRANKTVELSNTVNMTSVKQYGIDWISNNSSACLVANTTTFKFDATSSYADHCQEFYNFDGPGGGSIPLFGSSPTKFNPPLYGSDWKRIVDDGLCIALTNCGSLYPGRTSADEFICCTDSGYNFLNHFPCLTATNYQYICNATGPEYLTLDETFEYSFCRMFLGFSPSNTYCWRGYNVTSTTGGWQHKCTYVQFTYKDECWGFIPAFCVSHLNTSCSNARCGYGGIISYKFDSNGYVVPQKFYNFNQVSFPGNCMSDNLTPSQLGCGPLAAPLSVSVDGNMLVVAHRSCGGTTANACCYGCSVIQGYKLDCLLDVCQTCNTGAALCLTPTNNCNVTKCNWWIGKNSWWNTPHNMDDCPWPLIQWDMACSDPNQQCQKFRATGFHCGTPVAGQTCLLCYKETAEANFRCPCSNSGTSCQGNLRYASQVSCKPSYMVEMSPNANVFIVFSGGCNDCNTHLIMYCACSGCPGWSMGDNVKPIYCSIACCMCPNNIGVPGQGTCCLFPNIITAGGTCHIMVATCRVYCCCTCCWLGNDAIFSNSNNGICMKRTMHCPCIIINRCTQCHECSGNRQPYLLQHYSTENNCWYGAGFTTTTGCALGACCYCWGCGIRYNANTRTWAIGTDAWKCCGTGGGSSPSDQCRQYYCIDYRVNSGRLDCQMQDATGTPLDGLGFHKMTDTELFSK
jgi:hypothetical protein